MSSNLAKGTRLGRYEVIDALGAGAMGQVYLARDVSLNRQVAIKAMGTTHLNRPDLRARFAREARAVAAISHPNVVQIFDINEAEERPYFVMEYLKGTDVDALLKKRGRLSVSETVAIGLSSALGLSEAASAGVVHRDVKPANLFLTDRGTVKVTDFGLATGFELGANLTGDGITLGTPDYMPPEQGQGLPVDTRADVYALGATLYHLLAGRTPFRGADEQVGYAEVVVRHIKLPTPRLEHQVEGIDPQLAQLIYTMLAKDPAQRPTYDQIIASLREVALRLNAALPQVSSPALPSRNATGPEPVWAGPGETPSGSAQARAPRSRLPGWATGLTVASTVIFIGALALYLLLQPPPPPPVQPAQDPGPGTGAGSGSAGGRWWREVKAPAGSQILFIPGTGPVAVAEHPVKVAEIKKLAPTLPMHAKRRSELGATGVSLQSARRFTSLLGGRLPTSLEWLHLEASNQFTLLPRACEWVDDGGTKQARCYKGLTPVVRNIKLEYRDTVFRVVHLIERPGKKL